MIYNENPGDQLNLSIDTLRTLVCALEVNEDHRHLAATCQMAEWSIRDAFDRIVAIHKKEIETLKAFPQPAA
jgi:hypothetical protein